jgi:hypothetical protein
MAGKGYTFSVADIAFKVVFRNGSDALTGSMQQYEPFEVKEGIDKTCFTLEVSEQEMRNEQPIDSYGKPLVDLEEEGIGMRIYEYGEELEISLSLATEHDAHCLIHTDKRFERATLCVVGSPRARLFGLNNALMMLFAFYGARHHILVLHASAVVCRQRGYLFLGKSGTGKSTHAALWLKHIAGTSLLNDDDPVVRVTEQGDIVVYGSPWSGQTPCYINGQARVGGFVRLWQAPYNRIERLSAVKAYAALLPSITSMIWERSLSDAIHHTLNTILEKNPVFQLECRADEEAAKLDAGELIVDS